jgi:hypothetical protein
MRPSPIIWFERIVLLAFALGILNLGLGWRDFMGPVRTAEHVAGFWIAQCIYFGIYLLLIWLIARRGNAVARWIFVILVLIAAFLFVFVILPSPPGWPLSRTILAGAQCVLTLTGLGLIFGPDTGPWFRGRRASVDPEIFR